MVRKISYDQVKHLHLRAGFGEPIPVILEDSGRSPAVIFNRLLKNAQHTPLKLTRPVASPATKPAQMDRDSRKKLFAVHQENLVDLNRDWLSKMATAPSALREKMAFFWHDHFACRSRNSAFTHSYLETLRQHALGSFREMLFAVSKEPAMLQYLNAQQNRKKSPNENFAREVMELFTLGRGYYTEKDIKEAARAFTGWGFNLQGQFVFRKWTHDYDRKTIFTRSGEFNGDDVLNMLLENPQTARHLTTKLYRYLVNAIPDEDEITRLSGIFYHSDYDIRQLLEAIFLGGHFYRPENIGTRIKSPVELLVGIQRSFRVTVNGAATYIFIQKALGQHLLFPPNVSGWPEGRQWIDSSTLVVRTNLTRMLLLAGEIDRIPENSGDAFEVLKLKQSLKKIASTVAGERLYRDLRLLKNPADLQRFIFQTAVQEKVLPLTSRAQALSAINTYTQHPAYQLC